MQTKSSWLCQLSVKLSSLKCFIIHTFGRTFDATCDSNSFRTSLVRCVTAPGNRPRSTGWAPFASAMGRKTRPGTIVLLAIVTPLSRRVSNKHDQWN